MPAYLQLGHHSFNLVKEFGSLFKGAIISPVNSTHDEVIKHMNNNVPEGYEWIFDPQLYNPRSDRGKLTRWDYYPDNIDTADLSSLQWWRSLVNKLAKRVELIKQSAVCSPLILPKRYDLKYYELIVEVSNNLSSLLEDRSIDVVQSAIVNIHSLSDYEESYRTAGMLSKTNSQRLYIIFDSNLHLKMPFADSREIVGAMLLINSLIKSGLEVLVGYSSHDVILWKYAGADSCASGKFFNLRRFTKSRFETPPEGGGQIPYWFDESLLTVLRTNDLLRLIRNDMISDISKNDQYYKEVRMKIEKGKPWLATSWRQYLRWFANFINRRSSKVDIKKIIKNADNKWEEIEERGVLFDERFNNGEWVRAWRIAIEEYDEMVME